MRRTLLALALVFTGATSASAQIPTLFNTGVDAAGNQLFLGAVDPHYQAFNFTTVGTPGSLIGQAEVVNNGYQFVYPQNSTSRWIWATAAGNAPAQTMFRTTFDLTGYDLSTVAIAVSMSADNGVYDVFLNSVSLGQSNGNWAAWSNFTTSSGFAAGTNTLDFYAYDQGSPQAFNAYYTSRGTLAETVVATPEPASFLLLGTGLLAVAGITCRRRKAVA